MLVSLAGWAEVFDSWLVVVLLAFTSYSVNIAKTCCLSVMCWKGRLALRKKDRGALR